MKWKIKNNTVEDEKGNTICVLSVDTLSMDAAIIKYAPQMFTAILDFSESLESTASPRNPKKHYENFQRILENIYEASE